MKVSLSRSSILMLLALALLLAGRPRATQEGRRLQRSAFASIADLVAIAIILDVISRVLIFREFHPVAVLLVGPVVIALAYSCPGLWGIALPVGWLEQAGVAGRPG